MRYTVTKKYTGVLAWRVEADSPEEAIRKVEDECVDLYLDEMTEAGPFEVAPRDAETPED